MNFVKRHRFDYIFIGLIVLLNSIFSFDYVWHGTKPANFDAIAHITTIAQFHSALSDGEFPVGWGDGFANYGLPLGTIAHQLPAYGGAFLTFITNDVLMAFHIMYLFGAILSAVFFYIFQRKFLSPESSFLGSILYTLAPYRIINFYMRGAMPEFFSAVWIPLIMWSLYELHSNYKRIWPQMLFLVSSIGLILTHPMMLVVYAPVVGIWLLFFMRKSWGYWVRLGILVILTLGITAYYFVPLNLETKYLYHGMTQSHYAPNQTTTIDSFVNPVWLFNCTFRNDIFGRCHLIKAGVFETSITLLATFFTILFILSSRIRNWMNAFLQEHKMIKVIWIFSVLAAWVTVALSSSLLEPIYMKVRVLGNIQYPWRYLSSYLFLPPILLAIMFEFLRKHSLSLLIAILIVSFVVFSRFPQLYGKNYTYLPQSYYYFTPLNLHSFMMNTIWSGNTDEYPIKRQKAEIVQGVGKVTSRELKNGSRRYEITADTEVLISDNTFYFPGWNVYTDGQKTNIEFQDPAYRGVITFKVPPGIHSVYVVYEDTKVRRVGKWISMATLSLIGTSLVLLRIVPHLRKRRLNEA